MAYSPIDEDGWSDTDEYERKKHEHERKTRPVSPANPDVWNGSNHSAASVYRNAIHCDRIIAKSMTSAFSLPPPLTFPSPAFLPPPPTPLSFAAPPHRSGTDVYESLMTKLLYIWFVLKNMK